MRRRALCMLLVAAAAVQVVGGDLDDFIWREEFADAKRYAPRPTWLSAASATSSVASDGHVACFRVDEPKLGMKWSAPMPAIALADTPWLVLRYRAENLHTASDDYLIYLDDRIAHKQLHAVRLRDVVADGQWHTAAVDVTTLTKGDGAHALAVQVRATEAGHARLWLDWLALLPQPPEGAQIIQRVPVARPQPDWVAPIAKATWVHHNDWLSNPASADGHNVERTAQATVFRVAEPNRGMKWSWDLAEPAPLAGHRYVAMRCRATGLGRRGDYALCVIGKPRGNGRDYASVVGMAELVPDGRWHTIHADAREAAAQFPTIGALAVQVQAAAADATLEVADIRFVNARQGTRLADAVDWTPGAELQGFAVVPVAPLARSDSLAWRRHFRLLDWFTHSAITVQGIPFLRVPRTAELATTSVRRKADLRFPAEGKASEVFVLMLAALVGPEEPSYGGGKFVAIRDVDRFRLRLEYGDGTADECLPMNAATRAFGIVAGPQVVVAAADPSKPLKAVVVRDAAKQAAFAVAAITARLGAGREFPEALEHSPPLAPARLHVTPWATRPTDGTRFWETLRLPVATTWLDAVLTMKGLPVVEKLDHRPTGWSCLEAPCPLLEVRVDGKRLGADAVGHVRPVAVHSPYSVGDGCVYSIRGCEGLTVEVVVGPVGHDGLWLATTVRNDGQQTRTVGLTAPRLGPYRLSAAAADAWYLVPRRGAAFDNRPCVYRERYCGTFPVQFLDTFCPSRGRGLCLRTEDKACLRKRFLLEKKAGRFTIGVDYPDRPVGPGETLELPLTVVQATDGDWHRGLAAYRTWLRAWHKPLSPRKPWFREIFNFRQRFLHAHDPLYDHEHGTYHLQRAIDEARAEFGGIEYLHLFDWGTCGPHGRIYGRTGDHSPYDFLQGGRRALRKAIAAIRDRGVPVGLYIEGYLLTARGKLGQAHGKQWQLVDRRGQGVWWPGNVEMSICAGVPAWREVQASTYATKVAELGVDGMYIDQFGFANAGKDCWATTHGHPVPSYCVRTERDATRMIRQRIDTVAKGVAIYTEESPVDVTTQLQDGSFTYAMRTTHHTQTRVPLNALRFAVPDFKTIEILYCDKPTGSWATGVRWVFFNGEAIWLEGPAVEWFEPHTRATIRRCHRILRQHKDAFTTLQPVPLVPTQMGGVFANRFPAGRKTVYTLYNARHRTARGEVLRLPHHKGATYYDAWRDRPATVRRDGAHTLLATELGPHGVGCLVVERPPEEPEP